MIPMLILALATGCVPKKDYDLLQADLMSTKTLMDRELAERDEQNRELTDQVAKEQALVAELEEKLQATEAARALLQTQLDAANAEKAGLLKDRSALKASVAEMEDALRELAARKAAAEQRIAEYNNLIARFKPLIDAGRLKVKIVDGRMVVELPTDILFASGKADLSKEGREAIDEVGKVLATIPERAFQIEGHTDDVPIKTDRFPSNWELAAARAITVVGVLREAGVPAERLSAASQAEFRPVADNTTKEGKAANRRIEIVVVPDLSDLPGSEELEQIGTKSR